MWIHENLAAGYTMTRYADAQVYVYERLSHPGLLTAISKDPWNRHTITCATNFGSHVQLHDYTGRHPDIWTDDEGRATFTVPSNASGRGQSYLCFSRSGQWTASAIHPRSTTQTFFGAADLDTPPAGNDEAVIGRVWAAAGTHIAGEFRGLLDPRPQSASIALEILDRAGASLGAARVRSNVTATLEATTRRSGWHSIKTVGTGLPPSGAPFELKVTYTATQEFSLG